MDCCDDVEGAGGSGKNIYMKLYHPEAGAPSTASNRKKNPTTSAFEIIHDGGYVRVERSSINKVMTHVSLTT